MNKRIVAAIGVLVALLTVSCGVGNYSLSSGLADEAAISVVAKDTMHVVVEVDGVKNEMAAIKQKDWKRNRNLSATALNLVRMKPGRHQVVVYGKGGSADAKELYRREIFVSAGEHKIVKL